MTREERHKKIVEGIVDFSEIFETFALNGKPIFSDAFPTACICFNVDGSPIGFIWGKEFFDNCSDYKAKFILCHEMLHIFLKHGKRREGLTDMNKVNVCMDISINHLLIDEFGFSRSLIEEWEDLCWRDTVFETRIDKLPCFENYYALHDDIFKPEFSSIDSHDFLGSAEGLSDEIKKLIGDLGRKLGEGLKGCGEASAAQEHDVQVETRHKPRFEQVIKKIAASSIDRKRRKQSSWTTLDRRLCYAAPDIPAVDDRHERKCRGKHTCAFFIDNSGSCSMFLERFCAVAASLNPKVFEVSVYSFDTVVRPVQKIRNSYKVWGGGGTSFDCIGKKVEETNPDVVFVVTDGFAGSFSPADSKKYFWFLTEPGSQAALKQAGTIHRLSHFE